MHWGFWTLRWLKERPDDLILSIIVNCHKYRYFSERVCPLLARLDFHSPVVCVGFRLLQPHLISKLHTPHNVLCILLRQYPSWDLRGLHITTLCTTTCNLAYRGVLWPGLPSRFLGATYECPAPHQPLGLGHGAHARRRKHNVRDAGCHQRHGDGFVGVAVEAVEGPVALHPQLPAGHHHQLLLLQNFLALRCATIQHD